MPNIKSAKKRVKVIAVKTLRNKVIKSALKTSIRKYEAALADGNKELAAATYREAVAKIDKAVAKGIMHKNTAARRKSRFTRLLNAMA
ncbi:MAG: 30S ribosomal protein S20 [Clostridia bacterium]|nr:30S ribosomal protein S20 [Clostridia bacterium]